jgi:hypothetical protein
VLNVLPLSTVKQELDARIVQLKRAERSSSTAQVATAKPSARSVAR